MLRAVGRDSTFGLWQLLPHCFTACIPSEVGLQILICWTPKSVQGARKSQSDLEGAGPLCGAAECVRALVCTCAWALAGEQASDPGAPVQNSEGHDLFGAPDRPFQVSTPPLFHPTVVCNSSVPSHPAPPSSRCLAHRQFTRARARTNTNTQAQTYPRVCCVQIHTDRSVWCTVERWSKLDQLSAPVAGARLPTGPDLLPPSREVFHRSLFRQCLSLAL